VNWSDTRKKLLQLASTRATRSVEELDPSQRQNGAHGVDGHEPDRKGSAGDGSAGNGSSSNGSTDNGSTSNGSVSHASTGNGSANGSVRRAASLCVASGKGGTGKSVVSAALATLFRARGPTLIVDADLGVGNAHILQDVAPPRTFVDVVEGNLPVRDAVYRCAPDLDLVAGGSGVPRMADLSSYELHLIASGLAELEHDYRFLVVDSAAGVSRQTLAFARACDLTLLVTTPDLTAMTDVYAFLKLLVAGRPGVRPLLLVNRVDCDEEADEVGRRIARVGQRFLGISPKLIGWIPDDPAVSETVNRRGAVVALEPLAEASRALRTIAVRVLEELARTEAQGLGQMLQREVGYTERGA
jgi:flagellar biosynthesis protein FlhG